MKTPSKLIFALTFVAGTATARTPLPPEVVTDTFKIGEGTHLISVVQDDSCNADEINLEKVFVYDDDGNKTIKLSSAGMVGSNLVRPAVCRPGVNTGKILVTGPAKISAMTTPVYEPMKIAKVEKVTGTTEADVVLGSNTTLAAGSYIVELETLGSCHDQEINVRKSYEYGIHGDARTQILNRGNDVTDNLFRPMICRRFALDSAKVAIDVGPYTELVESEDLTIVSVQKITRTIQVSNQLVSEVTCRVPGLYDAGYNLVFEKRGNKVKSASVARISIAGGHPIETIQRCRNYGKRSFLAAKCRGRKAIAYLDQSESTAWLYERGSRGLTKLACTSN